MQRRLDRLLDAIDRRANELALVRRQFRQSLEQSGNLAVLAKEGSLDLLKRVRVVGRREGERRVLDDLVEILHGLPKKGGSRLLSRDRSS
jgi:hypothetical protein